MGKGAFPSEESFGFSKGVFLSGQSSQEFIKKILSERDTPIDTTAIPFEKGTPLLSVIQFRHDNRGHPF